MAEILSASALVAILIVNIVAIIIYPSIHFTHSTIIDKYPLGKLLEKPYFCQLSQKN
jgi:hypothetical protein